MKTVDGNYVVCGFSGKICYTEREAGLVINGCKRHVYVGNRRWVKSAHGNSKSIPRRKYYCKDCGFYHVTHLALYDMDSKDYAWEDVFYKDKNNNGFAPFGKILHSLYKIRNKKEFESLLDVLASSIGSLSNPLNIANTFKTKEKSSITNKTVSSYILYLEDAFLTQSVQRYDIKGRKHIEANKKNYFTDIGLRNAHLNFRKLEETHIMECDFVANRGTKRIYIDDNGIFIICLKDFLLNNEIDL